MPELKPTYPDKKYVQFDKHCSPYLANERALFPVGQAKMLVDRGTAHYVKQNKHGDWVAEEGVVKNADVKSDDDNKQGSGEEPKGAGEASGEAAPRQTRQRRGRQRAKLD